MAYKEVSAGATPPPENQRMSEGSGEPGDAYVITSLESIFASDKETRNMCFVL